MPASPSRIGFITEQYRRVTAGPSSTVQLRYGDLARDNSEPVETFFDSISDAQAMANERLTLLSADRRILTSLVVGEATGMALAHQPTLATATVIDDDRSYSRDCLIVGVTIDFASDRTEIVTWG